MLYLTVVQPSVLRPIADSGCLRGLPDVRVFQSAQLASQLRNIWPGVRGAREESVRSVWVRYSTTAHVLEVSLSGGSSAFLL